MRQAIGETERRRAKQVAYNEANGITPETIRKNIDDVLGEALAREFVPVPKDRAADEPILYLDDPGFEREMTKLDKQMRDHASRMEFEQAAELRDRILKLRRERLLDVSLPAGNP
jgi:excinuclease ABC subunit B